MNYRMIARILGYILLAEAVLLLLPLLVTVIYGEAKLPFLLTVAGCAVCGGALCAVPQQSLIFYARDGFFVVSAGWILMSLFGALPFYFSGEVSSFIDCLFETVSGLTTTGSSILPDVEALSRGLLFWRSFTHWIGGMGVLVFIMAVLPLSNEHSMHMMRAEMPGPTVGKLVPRTRDTALWLYVIYLGLTVLEAVFLLCGGMPLFDSITHAFSTAGTGGFSIKNAGIAAYGSDYLTMVVAAFMLLFGVNFNLYFLLLMREYKAAFRNRELHVYLGLIGGATALIVWNILPQMQNFWTAFREAFFHVASLITSTGFINADYEQWPVFSQSILLFLMVVGACAGSTGGGIKVVRLMMLLKKLARDLRRMICPRSVSTFKMDGKRVDEDTVSGVETFFIAYIAVVMLSMLLLSLNGYGIQDNLAMSVSCMSNIGPGLGAFGPTENWAALTGAAKLWLSFVMLLGRLEIFPLLLCLNPGMYRKK